MHSTASGLAFFNDHAAAGDLRFECLQVGGQRVVRPGETMVRHDVRNLIEPKMRQLREHFAFARNAVGHHAIEGRDAVAGHEKKRIAEVENLADLAALELLDARQFE